MNYYSVKLVKEREWPYETKKIVSPDDAYEIIRGLELEHEPIEKFGILTLNVANQVVGIHIIHIGGIASSLVDVRSVFQHALLNNACKIILFHNHPSGECLPSDNDEEVTQVLIQAGKILNIEVVDHIIVGGYGRYYSLKENRFNIFNDKKA